MNLISLALVVGGVLLVPSFLAVLIKNPRNPLNILFSFFTFAVIIWAFAIAFFRISTNVNSALLWDRVIYIAGSFVPMLVFFFCYLLSYNRFPKKIWVGILTILTSIFLGLLLFSNLWIKEIVLNNEGNKAILGPVYFLWATYLCIVYNAGVIVLIKKIKSSIGYEKVRLVYILLAATLPMLVGVVPNVLMPAWGVYKYIYIGPFASFAMSLVLTYAILKHRLFDIKFIVARSATYILMVIFLALIYSTLTLLAGPLLLNTRSNPIGIIIATFISFFIALTFQPIKKALDKATDNIFYKDRYDQTDLLTKLGKSMVTSLTLSNLTYEIADYLSKNMRLIYAAFLLEKDGKIYLPKVGDIDNPLKVTENEYQMLKENNSLLLYDELPEGEIKELFKNKNIAICLPLSTRSRFLGFLILGEKYSGDIFADEDLELLNILAPELAIALENSERYEKIAQFNVILQEEVKKATAELEEANLHLKELDSLKDEFISIASHELRTPITIIKNSLWMLINKKDSPREVQDKYLGEAYISTERAISLISDMLDVSKIETGRLVLKKEEFDYSQLVKDVYEELEATAEKRNISLKLNYQCCFRVSGDRSRLYQVVFNLVENALKYTPPSGKITISMERKEDFVQTVISDTGIGIKEEDISKLFVKFGRLNNSYTSVSENPGSGLGLYICKSIIELSGGKIWVESKFGEGSTFTFTLPIV